MFSNVSPDLLIIVAGSLQVLGYLIIRQYILRITLLAGTAAYVCYYFVAADTPLWGAIYASLSMGAANLAGIAMLLLRGSKFALPRRDADIYDRFADLPPGDFRALMGLAERTVLDAPWNATTEGQSVSTLSFVVSGRVTVQKGDGRFELSPGIFLGEVGYLTSSPASASTTIAEGSEVLRWSVSTLQRRSARDPRFKLALEAAISKDLAQKVARAGAPSRSPTPLKAAPAAD